MLWYFFLLSLIINPNWRKSMKKIIKSCITAVLPVVSLFTVTCCSQNIEDELETQSVERPYPSSEENSQTLRIFDGRCSGTYSLPSYSSCN